MYCCEQLQAAIREVGKKGIAVVAHADDGFRFFCLQSRACDFDDEERLKSLPASSDPIPRFLRIVSQIGIQFCPFCGARLETMITQHQEEFDELAKTHERILLH